MMDDADARRQTPGLATPMSATFTVTSHNQRSNSFSVICHASSVGLDNGYVKILPPNRIGLLLANHGGIINLYVEQI
jgi:hypothetical protein